MDTATKSLVIKNASGDLESYTWDDSLVVKYQNQLLSPSELKNGAVIKYTVKNNVLETVEVTQSVERTIRGTLYEVGANNATITYKRDGGQLEVKLLAEKPEDLHQRNRRADAQRFERGRDERRSGGNYAESAGSGNENPGSEPPDGTEKGATVVQYEPKSRVLTLMDANKKPYVVTLDEKPNCLTTRPNLRWTALRHT